MSESFGQREDYLFCLSQYTALNSAQYEDCAVIPCYLFMSDTYSTHTQIHAQTLVLGRPIYLFIEKLSKERTVESTLVVI